MAEVSDRSSLKSLLRSFLVFEYILGFLLLAHSCEGQSQKSVPSSVVTAMVGHDVVLPCHLKSHTNVDQVTVEWGRPDLKPRFVHVLHDMEEYLSDQNPAFRGRTSLAMGKMEQGDISLKLSDLRYSDNGRYRCFILKERREYFVDLIVGVSSSPGTSLAGLDVSSSRVELQCQSAGWYPEPEVFWLDDEENLLPAGPAETIKGPDGLFTVSSRVSVEKRHNNSFMCRVHQKNINQTRETHIHVPDDFFFVLPDCIASIIFNVIFCILILLGGLAFIWKWRQSKTLKKMEGDHTTEKQELLEELERKTLADCKYKLEVNVKSMEQGINVVMEIKEELESQMNKFTEQKQKAEEEAKKEDEMVRTIEEETKQEGDKTANKAKAYLKLKEVVDDARYRLAERKKYQQEFEMNTEKLVKKARVEVERMTGIKEEMEKMKKQMEEVEKSSVKDTKQVIYIFKNIIA